MTELSTSLFTAHPATNHSDLIQYNEYTMNSHLVAIGYADAARRLRASYRAEPWDDVMLLPFMFVWRQAIELALKSNIRDLAELRRQAGDPDPVLQAKTVAKRLRSPRDLGHNLEKLIQELQSHIEALELQDIPNDVLQTLRLLAALDNGGTGFRYAGVLAAPSADVNFTTLGSALDDAFRLLQVVVDAATYGEGVNWSLSSE